MRENARVDGNGTKNSLYARHFNETGHRFLDPTENVEIVRLENNISKRKLYEELEILKVRKKNSNALMNIKTEFSNEDMFYYILKE